MSWDRWMAPFLSPIAELGALLHEHRMVVIINLGGASQA